MTFHQSDRVWYLRDAIEALERYLRSEANESIERARAIVVATYLDELSYTWTPSGDVLPTND